MLAIEDNKLFLSIAKNKEYQDFYTEYMTSLELLCKATGWTLKEYLDEELSRIDQKWLEQKPITNKDLN